MPRSVREERKEDLAPTACARGGACRGGCGRGAHSARRVSVAYSAIRRRLRSHVRACAAHGRGGLGMYVADARGGGHAPTLATRGREVRSRRWTADSPTTPLRGPHLRVHCARYRSPVRVALVLCHHLGN